MDVNLSKDAIIDMIADTNDIVTAGSNKLYSLSDVEILSVLESQLDLFPWQFGTILTPSEARDIFQTLDL